MARKRTTKVSDDEIVCDEHGTTKATFVCQHLANGVACGFHANAPTPANPWPDACCDLCNQAWLAAGKWTKKALKLADIRVMCSGHYEAARDRNAAIPALAAGKRKPQLSRRGVGELLHHAFHFAEALQDESDRKWKWRNLPRWDLDADKAQLTLSGPRRTVVADVQFVGSFSTVTKTFQWAWATFAHGAIGARDVGCLPAFGAVRSMEKLTTANWPAKEYDGWEMLGLAAYLLGAEAVYRLPSDQLYWFMLLSGFRRKA